MGDCKGLVRKHTCTVIAQKAKNLSCSLKLLFGRSLLDDNDDEDDFLGSVWCDLLNPFPALEFARPNHHPESRASATISWPFCIV